MKTVAIIQARLGSTRLPGKVLLPLARHPMVWHVVQRVRRVPEVEQVVVATSTLSSDQPLVDYLHRHSVDVFRGPEEDVLTRYFEAAQEYGAEAIMRVTSDCPLFSPRVASLVAQQFLNAEGAYSYVSNTLERTFPRGLDLEIFSSTALTRAFRQATHPYEREHVTPFIWQHPQDFRLGQVRSLPDRSRLRWTVDESLDLALVRRIFDSLYAGNPEFEYEDVLRLLNENPSWSSMNRHVLQKQLV